MAPSNDNGVPDFGRKGLPGVAYTGIAFPAAGDLTVTTVENEARVLDVALAESLGMARPRDIRMTIIEPHRAELESFGVLRSEVAKPTGPLGGRPSVGFYLNRQQALLVCILSRTERAKEIRAEVIRLGADVSRSSDLSDGWSA